MEAYQYNLEYADTYITLFVLYVLVIDPKQFP